MSTTYLIAGGRNHANGFSVAAGVTKYYAPISDIANNVTETSVQLRIKDSYVVSKMTLYIGSNTLSGSCVFTSRKNSGPGNQTMTVTTGVTGEFQDLTHTDISENRKKLIIKDMLEIVEEMIKDYEKEHF